MDPVLIVGMNPSNKPTLGNKQNASFRRLESWMDHLNIRHFSFINTFDYRATPTLSKVDYKKLSIVTKEYNNIIALGGFVSSALERLDVKHFKMPHPSPLNRLLNDRSYEKQVLNECKEYLV